MAAISENLTWKRAGAMIVATPAVVWWLERLIALPRTGWFSPGTTFAIGGDLRTFYSAAYLAVHNAGNVVYDTTAFREYFAADAGAYGPFVNPPPFLALISPLGWFSFETAWVITAIVSLAGLVLGLWMIGLPRPVVGMGTAVLFPPVYFALTFGQPSVLWFVILAATYRLIRDGHLVGAGLVAGSLVMKPSLAVGLAVWWVLHWKQYRRAAVSAVAGGIAYMALAFALLPEASRGYLTNISDLLGEPDFPPRQWAQFSPLTSWRLLLPDNEGLALLIGLLCVGFALYVILPRLRRSTSLEVSFSAAVVITLAVTPYVIAYDWTLLLIPGVLLWRTMGEQSPRLAPAFVILGIASAWSTSLVNSMLEVGDVALQLAPLVLLLVLWLNRDLLFPATAQAGWSNST